MPMGGMVEGDWDARRWQITSKRSLREEQRKPIATFFTAGADFGGNRCPSCPIPMIPVNVVNLSSDR